MPRKTKDEEVIKKDKKKTAKASAPSIVEVVKNLVSPKKESKSKKTNSSKKAAIEVEEKSTSIKKSNKTSTKASSTTKKAPKTSAKKGPVSSKTSSKQTTTTAKKTTNTKKNTDTKATAKTPTQKASTKTSTAKKSATAKTSTKASTEKEAITRKSTTKKASTKTSTAKKSTTTKKSTTRKTTPKKSAAPKSTSKKLVATAEYYDLPAAYNRTIVKILAQTPSSLFVYWEISEDDKIRLQQQYGEEFFQNTRPYLIIKNETMNYSFEAEINDYANSWYIHIHDSDCKYAVQLVRKPINHQVSISSSFVDIISSNDMSIPNDHILFDKLGKTVFFRDVKNNYVVEKDISSLSFISNIGRIYNIYDLYKAIYKDELNGDEFGMGLSSSGFSSTFR